MTEQLKNGDIMRLLIDNVSKTYSKKYVVFIGCRNVMLRELYIFFEFNFTSIFSTALIVPSKNNNEGKYV